MKLIVKSVVILGLIATTIQDSGAKKKGCDCSICNGGNNRFGTFVGKKPEENEKSNCKICEKKKEMMLMERERQRKLKKCPFEILGSASMKGKTSEEIFDEFREQIVPSQNGFFDMMRGIVRTMHVTSVAELQRAKEKEAKELAAKKAAEEEEAAAAEKKKKFKRKEEESKPAKLTVVLKQSPCNSGSVANSRLMQVLRRRLPKHLEGEAIDGDLQSIDFNPKDGGHDGLDARNEDLFLETWGNVRETAQETVGGGHQNAEVSTESPFVKFMSNDEFKRGYGRREEEEDLYGNIEKIGLLGEDENVKDVDNFMDSPNR